MCDSTGESPASHEGTYLEADERDDELITMTRRQLRIIVRELFDVTLPRAEHRFQNRIDKNGNLYVRLDTITPEELAR